MHEIAFYIKPKIDTDEAWQQLEAAGCQPLYSSEEANGTPVIFGRLPEQVKAAEIFELCPAVAEIENAPFDPIDWEAQWAAHAEDYHNGCVHVQLNDYMNQNQLDANHLTTLKLRPGPGFGDLSHPTTRLVLALMHDVVKNKYVIDLGCGSGILALAALAMGAKSVVGIDIEADALEHARQNAKINGLTNNIQFFLPEEYLCYITEQQRDFLPKDSVVLMNMIQSEQQIAWASLKHVHGNVNTLITSGILSEGLEAYLQQCRTWHWQEVGHIENDGWLGFRFKK